MRKTTYTDTLLAGRKYDITSARLGDSSYQRMIDGKYLLFPPSFLSAADPSQYEFQNRLGMSEHLVEAKALLHIAEGMLNNWPRNKSSCKSFVSTWKSSPINIPSNVSSPAMQDYAIGKHTLDAVGPKSTKRQNDYKFFRYWFGIRHMDNTTGKTTYYPSITEIFSYNIPNMSKVKLADGSKEGTIQVLLKYDGSQCTRPHDIVVEVEVQWNDNTSSIEPYSNLIHMTPQGDVCSCRIQDYLGAYRNGLEVIEEKSYNDIPEKMMALMVYMAFAKRKNLSASDSAILTKLVAVCAKTQQSANMTDRYMAMKELDTTTTPPTVIGYGWASQQGLKEIVSMWKYVTAEGSVKVTTWGAFPAKFLDDVEYFSLGEVSDTGLVVCPHCKVCDYLEDANFIDFGGYFGKDGNPLTSVACEPKMDNGVYVFNAIGLIKCSHCAKGYYRKFNSQMRNIVEQIPIGEGELKMRKPYSSSWVIRSVGKGARMGKINGYMFREHTQGNLPSIIFYLYFAGVVKSVEYPLEVGTLSRIALKELVCTGASLKDGIKSHTYYDNKFAPSERDSNSREMINMKGGGKYRGPQAIWSGVDARTGTKSCKLCDKVGVDTTLGDGPSYQALSRDHLDIDRGDGSATLDRPDVDFFMEPIPHYKIRLTTPRQDKVRYLEVPMEKVGVALEEAPPIINIKPVGQICTNDEWAKVMSELIEDYGEALKTDKGIDAEFLVCQGLAWSARYDLNSREWLVSRPRSTNQWLNNYDTYEGVSGEIDSTTWEDGENRMCELVDGSQVDRFPAASCGGDVSYVNPYASCMATQQISGSHEIIVESKEIEEVDTPAGPTKKIKRYLTCVTCRNSYKGSQDERDASQFIIPFSTDPQNTPPLQGGEIGLFSPANKWHFTRFLYEPFNKTIDDMVTMDETKDEVKRYIPRNIYKWLMDGRAFPQSSPSPSSATPSTDGDDDE